MQSCAVAIPSSYCTSPLRHTCLLAMIHLGLRLMGDGLLGYPQNLDVAGMAAYVDWFNLMSYDIHGTWDGNSQWTSPVVQPHTNLTGKSSICSSL